jgi:tetratricopeptide (TPR) repeat protein
VAAQVFADKALEHFYSLEFDEAAAMYQRAIEREPENPEWWVGLAHVRMFQHLRSGGRLDAQIFSASSGFLPPHAPPDPQFERSMWDALERARTLCEKRLAANDRDAQAHYALGLAYAVESNFHVNARRKPLDALDPATKAREHHVRVRQLDPANHDANFVIGTYEYAIGSVPAAFRWVLYLVGHSGSKHHGVELIHDAMLHGTRVSPSALATLAYIYNRERQYANSRRMLAHLMEFYPRNYVFPMEIAASHLREGNAAAAAEAYAAVVRKFESGAPGLQRLDAARLYFQAATAHERAGQAPQAAQSYENALDAMRHAAGVASPPADAFGLRSSTRLHAEVLLRLGSISATLGEQAKARSLLEEAAATSFPEVRRAARAKLKALR